MAPRAASGEHQLAGRTCPSRSGVRSPRYRATNQSRVGIVATEVGDHSGAQTDAQAHQTNKANPALGDAHALLSVPSSACLMLSDRPARVHEAGNLSALRRTYESDVPILGHLFAIHPQPRLACASCGGPVDEPNPFARHGCSVSVATHSRLSGFTPVSRFLRSTTCLGEAAASTQLPWSTCLRRGTASGARWVDSRDLPRMGRPRPRSWRRWRPWSAAALATGQATPGRVHVRDDPALVAGGRRESVTDRCVPCRYRATRSARRLPRPRPRPRAARRARTCSRREPGRALRSASHGPHSPQGPHLMHGAKIPGLFREGVEAPPRRCQ